MEYTRISGCYKHYPTHFYIGFTQENEFCATTRRRELSRICEERTLGWDDSAVAVYCGAHDHVVFLPGYSSFHKEAAEKARGCKELEFFETCWAIGHRLGKAVVAGDAAEIAEALRRLRGSRAKDLLHLPPERLRELLASLEAAYPESGEKLARRLVEFKLNRG